MSNPHSPGNQFFSRRDALKASTAGFGMLALSGMCAEQASAAYSSPLSPKAPHFPPKGKRVSCLCQFK